MSLGSSRELAENKIILLYMINKINLPISNLQITKLILENRFMNYFLLQQFLEELSADGLLNYDVIDDKTFYKTTQKGTETLELFADIIPIGIKKRIDTTANSIRNNIRNETLITADFTPKSENEHIVECKVHEDDFALIDLKITVGTKNDARSICNNWHKHSHEIYSEIIDCLTKKRD